MRRFPCIADCSPVGCPTGCWMGSPSAGTNKAGPRPRGRRRGRQRLELSGFSPTSSVRGMGHAQFIHCGPPQVTFTHPSRGSDYPDSGCWRFMTRRMPRPEDVSRDHIDATVMGFLKGEKEADWTEVSLVTLHPREEIRLVLRKNRERYRTVNEGRFFQLLARLKPQGVSLHAG